MATWLDINEAVANNLGKTDGATYSVKRYDAINRARRKFYSETTWSVLRKNGVTISLTDQAGSLPADFNGSFDPLAIYTYTGNVKYNYQRVDWDDLVSYGSTGYVYALNPDDGSIKVSQPVAAVLIDYVYLPADVTATDGSSNSQVEPAPNTTAIELLATGYLFMSTRQSASKLADFTAAYKEELAGLLSKEAQGTVPRLFSRQARQRIATGYNVK